MLTRLSLDLRARAGPGPRLWMKRKIRHISGSYQRGRMPCIQLTDTEQRLRALLLDVAAYIDKDAARADADPLVLRWAGGWVRDKLLGHASHDVDTAINSMTGFPFAEKMREFCAVPDHVARHSIGTEDISNLYKVGRNPDKSKCLETAAATIFGVDLDFVNLRRETYVEDSRNPQMEFGTPEEDALRRDATVNALFYNLHTGQVEDFTGGVADLGAKLIRTPMAPLQTFMDDPLRVLRLVRFASRLGFRIDEDAERFMGDPRVLDALRLKISRERVGIEVDKMLRGKHPRDSLHLLDRLGLYHTVFTDPGHADVPRPDTESWKAAYECLRFLAANNSPGSIYQILVRTEDEAYLAWVLAALAPWAPVPDPEPKPGKKAPPPFATLAAREGMRAPNKHCEVITAAARNRRSIARLKDAVQRQEPIASERDRFGMAIRRWDERGGPWRLQVLYAVLVDVMEQSGKHGQQHVLSQWHVFLDHLQELDVMDAPALKRLTDGKKLSAALDIKPGTWMKDALDICTAWQLRNPDKTDLTAAYEEVRQWLADGKKVQAWGET